MEIAYRNRTILAAPAHFKQREKGTYTIDLRVLHLRVEKLVAVRVRTLEVDLVENVHRYHVLAVVDAKAVKERFVCAFLLCFFPLFP